MSGEDIERPPRFDPCPTDAELLPQDKFDHEDPQALMLLHFNTPVPTPYVRSLRIELEDRGTEVRINCRTADVISIAEGCTYLVELVPYAYNAMWKDSTWATLTIRSQHIPGHDWTQDIERIIVHPANKKEDPYFLWNNGYVIVSRPYSAASESVGTEIADGDDPDLTFNCTDNAPTLKKYFEDEARQSAV